MFLKILASSSAGNGYILSTDTETLIIEAGMKLSILKKALNYDLSKVVGCVVSHCHNDHSGNLKEYAQAGITCLALQSVLEAKGIASHHRAKTIEAGKGYKVGNFKIIGFPVAHDVPCLGLLINSPSCGNILFLTDTFTCEYRFDDLNTIMIEANYSDDILDNNISSGKVSPAMRKRLMFSHMELQTTKQLLLSNDLSQVSNIVLIHLSSGNSNEKGFIDEIQRATGKVVYAADKGLEINIDKMPY